jgi:hypothetical protein
MLQRCEGHTTNGWPQEKETGYTYVAAVEPVGYPDETAAICGREGCEESALVFLDDRQYWRFQYRDERIFRIHKREDVAVEVTDDVVRDRSELARPEEYGPDNGNWPEYPSHDSAEWEG